MKIGFIGAGNMGSALAKAAAGENEVFLYDKDSEKAAAVAKKIGGSYADGADIAKSCDYIFLAVKPNIIPEVARELAELIHGGAVLVSMAAGVTLSSLESYFPGLPIIRIMPNTPCAVGMGMILWCANSGVSETSAQGFLDAMYDAGDFLRIDEKKIDAGTAVSGCGPAFVYMFIDAMIKGGIEAGLSPREARTLATRTVAGAAEMVEETESTPEELRIAVCSPGGSTIEGVKSLMGADFENIVKSAVGASFKRTQELGK